MTSRGGRKGLIQCEKMVNTTLHDPFPLGTRFYGNETFLNNAVAEGPSDAHNQVISDDQQNYIYYGRKNFPTIYPNVRWRGERGVRILKRAANGGKWKVVSEWRLDRRFGSWEHLRHQLYSLSVSEYAGIKFGLITVLEWPRDLRAIYPNASSDTWRTYLAPTIDQINFDLSAIYAGQPSLQGRLPSGEATAEASFDRLGAASAAQVVTFKGKHWLYYLGCKTMHEEINDTPHACAIGVATMKLDRLACLSHTTKDNLRTGEVTTKPFELLGGTLEVNIDTTKHDGGHIFVEVLDEDTRPVPGYSKDEAAAAIGDHINLQVKWHKSLGELVGRTVALRFHVTNAELCAFQVKR